MNLSSEVITNYLRDLVPLLIEEGDDVLEFLGRGSKSAEEIAFESGKAFGIFQSLSLIKSQAIAFGIPLKTIGMDKIDLDDKMAQSGRGLAHEK